MYANNLVEWQVIDSQTGLVFPWLTHPFLEVLKSWDLSNKTVLETGGGRSSCWWRKKSLWVDTIEADAEWGHQIQSECDAHGLSNGRLICKTLPDGVQERKHEYFDLFPTDKIYDIIVVDGIWRYEVLEWALNHFKGRGGILIADNYQQDYVWICPSADVLMQPFKIHRFFQPAHTNHEGRPWNTVYWEIPKDV